MIASSTRRVGDLDEARGRGIGIIEEDLEVAIRVAPGQLAGGAKGNAGAVCVD